MSDGTAASHLRNGTMLEEEIKDYSKAEFEDIEPIIVDAAAEERYVYYQFCRVFLLISHVDS